MGEPTGFLKWDRETPQMRPVPVRLRDWNEVYEDFDPEALTHQAGRCMDCGIPFCNNGCPLGNLIPDWNDLVYRDHWQDAIERLHATNNFPEFTGRLCPAPCETSCVLGINADPVTIKQVEVSIIDRAWNHGWVVPDAPDRLTGMRVAVVGSGPAAAQDATGSVVVTTEEVYGAFYDDYTRLSAFLHSHSYTGNPLACAAALATLDIFESDRVVERNRALADRMAAAAAPLAGHPNVAELRQTGMILAIELVRDRRTREPFDWRERRGLRLYEHALSRGVLLRPLGPVVYWMPPYVIGEDEVALLAEVTAEGIDLACA